MSDSEGPDDIEAIRKRKRERLKEQLDDGPGAGESARSEPVHVESADHFRDLVADGTVLVDFYADWCGPCQMLEPTVEAIAAETSATVAKVDVDAHQSLAAEHGVQGVPMLVLYADGEVAEQLVGVQDRATLETLIDRYT
ncbi:thiol reductase thioredoxin [Halobacteriales archaeon QS_1_68_17]|nr:MAG: thiol reductase thioredoxin [Halobacteriales archaeon QS_1_68_17]